MGIRVKKVVGYGLTDLNWPDDARLNPEGFLCCKDQDRREDHWTAEGYRKFLTKHCGTKIYQPGRDLPTQDLIFFELHRGEKRVGYWGPWESIIHDAEFGLSSVLVVIPFCMSIRGEGGRWKRYDDIIDYCEETGAHEQARRVLPLRQGIHPWDADWEDADGRTVSGWEVSSRHDGFSRWTQEGYRHVRPFVPAEVRALCAYLELFKTPDVAKSMEPLLYVYWA